MTFLLLPPYLIVAVIVIWRVVRSVKGKGKKWGAFFILVFSFYLPLGWDIMLGRAYFYYLCETQGGVHVYSTVELGSEYWAADGSPVFISSDGFSDGDEFNRKYIFKKVAQRNFFKTLNIAKYPDQVINTETGGVLGEKISFVYFGGWFLNSTGFVVAGTRCHGYSRGHESGSYRDFINTIFVLKK